MLTYIQVLLYYLVPPIVLLLGLYYPLLGRRDALKLAWVSLMATLWTAPWDNWILSQSGWGYPPNSILGKIFHVPIEEHLFFILQPILIILLHTLLSHPYLIPFDLPPNRPVQQQLDAFGDVLPNGQGPKESIEEVRERTGMTVLTLPRRPIAASLWLGLQVVGAFLVNEAHGRRWYSGWTPAFVRVQSHAFYLGWIFVWISPVIAFLTFLGARYGKAGRRTFVLSSMWLVIVDTIAIRSGAWFISPTSTLGVEVWRGLPLEEFIFFLLTTHLIILSSSIITHLHTLLLLSPTQPPCPPSDPIKQISLLFRAAVHPPRVNAEALHALVTAEETLRRGSKSFTVAKLAFGREMRVGLVAIYAWCRVTDNLMDDPIDTDSALNNPSEDVQRQSKLDTLTAIRKHLEQAYQYPAQPNPNSNPDRILDSIPNMTPEERSAFHLFATIVPRLVPIYPFLELCAGYETDLQFVPSPTATDHSSFPLAKLVGKPDFALEEHLPIKTTSDLLKYADNVAGSIASAICYLSWSLLTIPDSSYEAARPVDSFVYAASVHLSPNTEHTRADLLPEMARRASIVSHAREMGRALQLVNISRDIAKDASIGRLYIPLSSFPTAKALLGILLPKGSSSSPTSSGDDGKSRYTEFNLPLLNIADDLRRRSEGTIELLPRTARGGTRAMVASYFEIAKEIRRRNGEVDERGIKVNKLKRLGAATRAMWLGL